MKILIYGAGAIGIALGTFLSNDNVEVDYIASKRTGNVIEHEGIYRGGILGESHIPSNKINVYYNVSEIEKDTYDYILVTVKTTSNKEVSKELGSNKGILKTTGKIIIMQNGWGNDKEYLRYFTKKQIYSARVITGFERKELNNSIVTVHADPIIIGSLYNESINEIDNLVEILNDAGMPTVASNEIDKALWAKMLYNCTLNPLGALMKVNYGKLSESKYTINIMNNLIDETFNVMTSSGYSTYFNSSDEYKKEFYDKLIISTYNHRSSTLQDMEKGIKTEIDSLTGIVIRLAKENNINVPYSEFIYNSIKGIEDINNKK